MMLVWMAYAITVSALLSAAALAAEHVAMAWRTRVRWIWALAIATSVALPAAVPSASVELPAMLAPQGGNHARTVFLRDLTSPALAPAAWVAPPARAAQAGGIDTDTLVKRAWQVASIGMLAALAACAAWLSWRRRRWSEREMAGAMVLVSEDVGPAVVGFLRPRIVVPAWLAEASAEQQELVVAHEQGHLDAGDPRLLALVLLVLLAMPWNLPLWWQARRLRMAVEVDCDARVLRDGHSLQRYAAALIDVGQRQSAFAGTAAAMTESPSSLEHRIRIMAAAPPRWARRAAPAVAALSLCMAAIAARVEPPEPVHCATIVPNAVLRSHAGYYQLDEHRVIVVVQSGDHLAASINMERSMRLNPESESSFFVEGQRIEFRFERDGLIVREYGVDHPSPRVGPEAVEAADAFVRHRFAGQRAFPGSEMILHRNLELAATGQLRLDDFSPAYGRIAQGLVSKAQSRMAADGKIVAIRFDGVNRAGWDLYRVQYEHGLYTWYLWLNSSGKVTEAVYRKEY